mmetsp:Transcript_51497/g.120764  ORF Transcript_51497/g.120764 Transcript_51497/m.120764 type:complete len:92 (+) Transcript_51497:2221-2496(+)
MDDATWRKASTDSAELKRAKDRKDTEEPMCLADRTDKLLHTAQKLLMLMLDPRLTQSTSEIEEPSRLLPQTDTEEPIRCQIRRDSEEPSVR